MAEPTNPLLVWANQDVVLPNAQRPNKKLPQAELVETGWDLSQKPAADEWNYLLNNYGEYLSWLVNEKISEFLQKSQNLADVASIPTSRTNLDVFSKAEVNGKTISAGNGLTGGGDLSTNRTIDMGTPGTVGVGSSNIATADSHTHALDVTNNISILTGTIADGGTIPLPAGYIQAQCKWFVSPNTADTSGATYDVRGDATVDFYNFVCSANASRVVTVTQKFAVEAGYINLVPLANYIIIGVK